MLKIKDDVDLEELKKFGMKPKYDVDTGIIRDYAFNLEQIAVGNRLIPFHRRNGIEWYDCEFVDEVLFDLIEAGLVEKVGDNQ